MLRNCPYIDAGDAWKCPRCGDARPKRSVQPPRRNCPTIVESCIRKGAELRRDECQTCQGAVKIKVFACVVHGECTTAKALPGIKCCHSCTDHISPTVELQG